MLGRLPFDVQLIVMRQLDRTDLRSACLVSRRLNDSASRRLYTEVIWKEGCCESHDATTGALHAAFNRRPHLIPCVASVTLIASVARDGLLPILSPLLESMVNLRAVGFAKCGKCQRHWDGKVVVEMLRFLEEDRPRRVIKKAEAEGERLGITGPATDYGQSPVGLDHRHGPDIAHEQLRIAEALSHVSGPGRISWPYGYQILPRSIQRVTIHVEDLDQIAYLASLSLEGLEDLAIECSSWNYDTPSPVDEKEEQGSSPLGGYPSLQRLHILGPSKFIPEGAHQALCILFQTLSASSARLEDVYLGPSSSASSPRLNPPYPSDVVIHSLLGLTTDIAQSRPESNPSPMRSRALARGQSDSGIYLRHLDLSSGSISGAMLARLLSETPNLRDLHLSCSVSDLTNLAHLLPKATEMRELHVNLELPWDVANPEAAIQAVLAAAGPQLRSLVVIVPTRYNSGARRMEWLRNTKPNTSAVTQHAVLEGPISTELKVHPLPRMPSYTDRSLILSIPRLLVKNKMVPQIVIKEMDGHQPYGGCD